MSVKNSSQITNDIATYLPDNTGELISALDLRNELLDIVDSYVNTTDFFTGATDQYVSGDGSLQTLPTVPTISDIAYDATTWNTNTDGATKNAIRDEIEAIYTAISAVDLTSLWNKSGNTLSARGKIGSTSGAFGYDFYRDNIVTGGQGDTTGWYWGTNAAFTDTDNSYKGSGNTSASWATKWQNSSSTEIASLDNAGLFDALNGFAQDGNVIMQESSSIVKFGSLTDAKGVELWTGGIKVMSAVYADFLTFNGTSGVIFQRNGTEALRITSDGVDPVIITTRKFYNNSDGYNVADLFTRQMYNNVGNQVLNWSSDVEILNYANFAVCNSGGSYGGGQGVMFLANASTAPSSDPTGGGIIYVESGALKYRGSSGTITTLGAA